MIELGVQEYIMSSVECHAVTLQSYGIDQTRLDFTILD